MYEELKIKSLYPTVNASLAYEWLCTFSYPWEAISGIAEMIGEMGSRLSTDEFDHPRENVWIAKSAKVAPTAWIDGPCIIDQNAEIRHCAFIRGSALIGKGAVVGNSTELKNCILFDGVQVPHYNYVGDSILGYRAHMGAGAITSNVKSDKSHVSISVYGTKLNTERKKLGAMLGDFVEVGCNTVLNPGTVIGVNSNVYPCACVRGFLPENSIYKSQDRIITKRQEE